MSLGPRELGVGHRAEKRMAIDREVVAFHEAGHAVAAIVQGMNADKITIEPEGDAAGYVTHDYGCNMNKVTNEDEPTRQWVLERAAIVSLAGEVAQRRFRPESVDVEHTVEDHSSVHNLLSKLAGDTDQELLDAWWKLLHIRTERLIERYWLRVEWIASVLLKQKTIEGEDEVQHVFGDAVLPPGHRGKRLSISERLALPVGKRLTDTKPSS